jgi:hypothetical protein
MPQAFTGEEGQDTMSTGRLHQLHAELEELTVPAAHGLHSLLGAISGAAGSVSGKVRPVLHQVQDGANPARFSDMLLTGASVLGGLLAQRNGEHQAAAPARERRPGRAAPQAGMIDTVRAFLLRAMTQVWLAAGVADWTRYRRGRVQHAAGSRKLLIPLLMLGEAVVPAIAGMTLEITSPVLLIMLAAVVLHAISGVRDAGTAMKHRTGTRTGQQVNGYLKLAPVTAAAAITVLHWPELRALLGMSDRSPDWTIRRKARPLPLWAAGTLLSSMVLFEVLPYVAELRRTRRH